MSQRARKKHAQLVQPTKGPRDISEARRVRGASQSRSFSLAWDETEALGITADMRRSGPGMLSDQERKETLYQSYLNNVWISACVDVIAKRITSGGFIIEEVEQGKGSDDNRTTIDAFLHYINDDEDFLQLIRSIATDLLIYGEAYMEVISKAFKPYSLVKVDCQTMNYTLDQHGNVLKYTQNMTHSTDTVEFQPDEIVRWWLPDSKAAKKALSPIERILGPTDADAHMSDWVRQFFRKGARPPFWIKFPGPEAEAKRFVAFLRENYTGRANAHVPMVLYDEAELFEIGKGSIDVDFLKGRDQTCKEILAAYQVPPALVGLIESGNIGGGTGESQEKSFQFNACDPLRQLIFEKFNYRVVQKGFGITDWTVNTRYADYRSDDMISKIQDIRIRNGSNTINEIRAEMGKAEIPGGDTAVFAVSKEVIPVERLAEMADEQRQTASLQIEQQSAQVDMAKTKADQAKNPPPAPPMLPPGQQSSQPQQKQAKESADTSDHWQDTNDGVQSKLKALKEEGIQTITWRARAGACGPCLDNDGQTISVGGKFKSGACIPPEHNRCECDYEDNHGRVFYWTGVDGDYKQYPKQQKEEEE